VSGSFVATEAVVQCIVVAFCLCVCSLITALARNRVACIWHHVLIVIVVCCLNIRSQLCAMLSNVFS